MHDLRRTVGTYMSRLGVPKDIRERILNHGGKRKGSITDGAYNHYEYDAERRAALELWPMRWMQSLGAAQPRSTATTRVLLG
jgi:integrase